MNHGGSETENDYRSAKEKDSQFPVSLKVKRRIWFWPTMQMGFDSSTGNMTDKQPENKSIGNTDSAKRGRGVNRKNETGDPGKSAGSSKRSASDPDTDVRKVGKNKDNQ